MSTDLPRAQPLPAPVSSERYALYYELRPCVSLTLFISGVRGCPGKASSIFVARVGNWFHAILSQIKLDDIGRIY
jgi:hypothetical protein